MSLKWTQFFLAGSLVSLLVSDAIAGKIQLDDAGTTPDIEQIQLKVAEPFLAARARILKFGWKPVRMHKSDNYEYSGAEVRLVERKFFEVYGCSTDAGVNCILYYRKPQQCLRLDTVGEQVAYMTVTRWTNECPVVQP
jgi:hypothetical protein